MGNECPIDLRRVIDLLKDSIGKGNPIGIGHEVKKIFDTNAWEFLSYCRQDLNDESERGRTNALSNAKRAIECRADEILKLLNLKHIASKQRWGLPYKLQVLKVFGITAPEVLTGYITSRRNILEHEYVKPKTTQEIQYIADITELFLSASDNIVKKGYITSVEFTDEKEFEREEISKWKEKSLSYKDEFKIKFVLDKETMVFTHKQFECFNEHDKRTGEVRSRENLVSEQTTSISLHDCKEVEIKELMQLLVEP